MIEKKVDVTVASKWVNQMSKAYFFKIYIYIYIKSYCIDKKIVDEIIRYI